MFLPQLSRRLHRLSRCSAVNGMRRQLSQTRNGSTEAVGEPLEMSDTLDKQFVPRRALLYCPGNDSRKIAKLTTIANSVDSVVLDCEDGVAMNKKVSIGQTKSLLTVVCSGRGQTYH